MAYQRLHKTDTRIVRIFNTYGPRMRPEDGRVIPNFFSQALAKKPLTIYGDGQQTRSLCYVRAIWWMVFNKLMQNDVKTPINIGNPDEYTILDVAKNVAAACGVDYKQNFMPYLNLTPNSDGPTSVGPRTFKTGPQSESQRGF